MILYIILLWLELLATELSSDIYIYIYIWGLFFEKALYIWRLIFKMFFGGILAKAIYIASCHAIMLFGQINNVMRNMLMFVNK